MAENGINEKEFQSLVYSKKKLRRNIPLTSMKLYTIYLGVDLVKRIEKWGPLLGCSNRSEAIRYFIARGIIATNKEFGAERKYWENQKESGK